MRLLLDENVDRRFHRVLTSDPLADHDVTTIGHDYPSGISDREVLDIARRERRVLITHDVDFAEHIVREGLPHAGVVLLRFRTTAFPAASARLSYVLRLRRLLAWLEKGHVVVVTLTVARVLRKEARSA